MNIKFLFLLSVIVLPLFGCKSSSAGEQITQTMGRESGAIGGAGGKGVGTAKQIITKGKSK
jgi:hypothetical protein